MSAWRDTTRFGVELTLLRAIPTAAELAACPPVTSLAGGQDLDELAVEAALEQAHYGTGYHPEGTPDAA